jgi:hypothetical protein
MNHESLTPSSFSPERQENFESRESFLDRKIKLTRKVLKQLAFWGFLSMAALAGSPFAEADIAVEPAGLKKGAIENIKKSNIQKAKRIESKLKEKVQGREVKSEKPVIAIVAKSDLERFDDKNIPRKMFESYTRERLITKAVQEGGQKFDFVDRSENTRQAIEDEINLTTQSSDLFNPETIPQPKHLNPDYYVVVSEGEGADGTALEIEIINMKDGSIKKISTSKNIVRSGKVITEDEAALAADMIGEVGDILKKL